MTSDSTDKSAPTSPAGPIRIILADDHRFFRDGVRALLTSVADFTVVDEAGNGDECVAKAAQHQPHVILMDIQMPGLDGVEATRRILHDRPETGIIILTMFEETDSLLSAVRAGARGYILKDADEAELIRSIRAVASGELLFGSSVARRMQHYIADTSPDIAHAAFPELTEREREILALIAQGMTNHEIASRVDLSLKTVRNHVSSILTKLRVADKSEAIARARAAGLQTEGRTPPPPPR